MSTIKNDKPKTLQISSIVDHPRATIGNGNLKPFGSLTEERQREIRAMGGRASIEKKVITTALMKELAKAPYASAKELATAIDPAANPESNVQVGVMAVISQMQKGNINAASLVMDRIEGKLTDKLEAKVDFAMSFVDGVFERTGWVGIDGGFAEDEEQ